ncbi:glycosyltransferase family 2 protein [Flavobacterium sp. P4023]|uniref:Glycosyltransferase family 2 protein n=1 Tax=Flavobacterium flabelliforme TaxID=2816119 RepID=A0ABS5CRF1_9FLAO|nr:glycosyltransferase family 2 protein [Flavobacterium flabelliforme]MBP4141193.1 glycosyltransferase family 2 protein [Flavobacterium flabelliforme]
MKNPLVSIITPAFNSEKYITESIQSVLNQTYQNWEMIIVDDASSDATISIIEEFIKKDNRIKICKHHENAGTGIARNTALNETSGKYIAFLDADDVWKPTKLEKQVHFLQINKIPFTFSFYEIIDENGKALNKRIESPLILSYQQLFFCNYVGNLTGIYDVDYFGKISISSIRKRQDWMLWLRILQKIKSAPVIPESLAYYRIRKNSISASKFDLVYHNFKVYRTFHGYNLFVSLLCMTGFLFTQLLIKPRYIKAMI